MKKYLGGIITFLVVEVLVYVILIANQNNHTEKELHETLNKDKKDIILISMFKDEKSKDIFLHSKNIYEIDINRVNSINDLVYVIDKINPNFDKDVIKTLLRTKKIYDRLHEKDSFIEIYRNSNERYSFSFIPQNDNENIFYFKYENKPQISDFELRTLVLFMVLSLINLAFIIYTFILQNFKENAREKKEFYKNSLRIIDKYILMSETDTEGFITNVSRAFCNVTGYSKEELIGRPHNVLRHPDTPHILYKNMWDTILAGKIWEGELKNKDKFGNSYWVKARVVPKYDKHNKIIGFISFREDVTSKKQLDKLNNQLKQEIKQKIQEVEIRDTHLANQAKKALVGDMVDIIAHQWKQPLSIMSLYAIDMYESVKYNEMNEEYAKELSEKFKTQIGHLANTLNEFRTFFRPNELYDKFNLYENLINTVLLVKDELVKNHIEIDVKGDKNVLVYGIANQFQHVMLNFISNTKDAYIEKNIQNRQIHIEFVETKNGVTIDYYDNAGGIKEHIINKIFELNFTTKPIGVGTGVGLYISKLIIQKMNGEISVKNKNNGVNFTIILPNLERRVYNS